MALITAAVGWTLENLAGATTIALLPYAGKESVNNAGSTKIAFINSHARRDSVITETGEVTKTPQAVSFMPCARVAALPKNN